MKTGSAHQHPPTHTKHTRPPSLLSATASTAIPPSCPPLSCPYRRFDEPLCNCLCNEAATAAGSIHCNKRQLQQCCPSAPYLRTYAQLICCIALENYAKSPQKKQSAVRCCCLHVVFVHVIKYQMTPPLALHTATPPLLLLLLLYSLARGKCNCIGGTF